MRVESEEEKIVYLILIDLSHFSRTKQKLRIKKFVQSCEILNEMLQGGNVLNMLWTFEWMPTSMLLSQEFLIRKHE